jgi:prepilin peptidase CpaA
MQVSQGVIWFVSVVLVVAAVIDGWIYKVPNWLTFPFFLMGLTYCASAGGARGLGWSLEGAALGLTLLLILYAIGGMGSGDVKLLAGVGAWIGPWLTLQAFVATALAGGVIGLGMIVWYGEYFRLLGMVHLGQEILTVRNPVKLAELAEARKPTRLKLAYAIPIAVGTIASFVWAGLMF